MASLGAGAAAAGRARNAASRAEKAVRIIDPRRPLRRPLARPWTRGAHSQLSNADFPAILRRRRAGCWIEVEISSRVLPDGRWFGTVRDITERKAREARMRLLTREVDHRANNLMAVVQGAVSLSQADTVPELKRVLIGRITAL